MDPRWLDNGVLAAIIAASGYALWRTGSWLATSVILPVAQAHIKFLETLGEGFRAQTQLLQQITRSQEEIQRTQQDQHGLLLEIRSLVQRVLLLHNALDKTLAPETTKDVRSPGEEVRP